MIFIAPILYEFFWEWHCASGSFFLEMLCHFWDKQLLPLLNHHWTLLISGFICVKDICSKLFVEKLQGFKIFQKCAIESRYGQFSMFLGMFFWVEHARARLLALLLKKYKNCKVFYSVKTSSSKSYIYIGTIRVQKF